MCAAALATHIWAGDLDMDARWIVDVPGEVGVEADDGFVDVPGGRLTVRLLPGRRVELSGPAVLVADGTVDLP